jgi:[ribosomal protein S5]-alanine N-acetyltransferase
MLPEITLPIDGYAMRSWSADDAVDMQHALNNPNIGQYLGDWYPEDGYTLAMADQWCNGGVNEYGGTCWAITFQNLAIGSGGLHPQQGFSRCNSEIGYWLAQAHWGKGVGSAVVAILTKLAFEQTEITRLFAPIHATNVRSQRVCEKNGFVREGLLRQSTMKWSKAIDVVLWARYRNQ